MRRVNTLLVLVGLSLLHGAAGWKGQDEFSELQNALLVQPSAGELECDTLSPERVRDLNLTAKELAVLPSVCWNEQLVSARPVIPETTRGIPEGVSCKVKKWCDHTDCTDVCERGTVHLEPWHKNALKTQIELAKRLPFCYAAFLGSHNSGITIADGYGNLDASFQQYFKWIRWVANNALLRTNDQYLSLTDQMNLGVRSVELDTHWFEGQFRIAHCGGYHGNLDLLINALNVVAKLLGREIRWDTETIGCEPSLSSIPVLEQRSLVDALQEVHAWLEANPQEFVVLYLDDQKDIAQWGKVPALLADFAQVFSTAQVFTPLDLANRGYAWPSINDMVAEGKRVLVVSGVDYLTPMAPLIFSRVKVGKGSVCDWAEYPFAAWQGEPSCAVYGDDYPGIPHTLEGVVLRESACEIQYGPLNCDMVWRPDNAPLMNAEVLHGMSRCGMNMPSPDLLTPKESVATIWSWAEGHPFPVASTAATAMNQAASGAMGSWWQSWVQAGVQLGRRWLGSGLSQVQEGGSCAATSAEDGRWRAVDCALQLPTACRVADGSWHLQNGDRGVCPSGTVFELPRHAKENTALQHTLHRTSVTQAWLPLQGPDWELPPMGPS